MPGENRSSTRNKTRRDWGHHLYGMLEKPGNLPIGMAEGAVLLKSKKRNDTITWNDVRFPEDDPRLGLWKEQTELEA